MRTFAGGWEVAGIVTLESGAPLNMGVNGSNVSSFLSNTGNRPDLNGKISYPKKATAWFDPSAFSAPACSQVRIAMGLWGITWSAAPVAITGTFRSTKLHPQRRAGQPYRIPRGELQHLESHSVQGRLHNNGISTNVRAATSAR